MIYDNESLKGRQMIALLQSTPTVAMPAWAIGMMGSLIVILLGIIGYLIKFVVGTFKSLVKELKDSLDKWVEAFQSYKDGAPKEFVTHPFLAVVRQELKDDIKNGHRRIGELAERFEKELADHKKDCPVRAIRTLEGG